MATAKAVTSMVAVAVALMTVVLEEMQGAYERITITTRLSGCVLAGDAFPGYFGTVKFPVPK